MTVTELTHPPVATPQPGRRPELEEWMTASGLVWAYHPAWPLEQLDMAGSLLHQARIEPLDETVVERYAGDYARGDDFPAILVVGPADAGRGLLAGGNHRTAAARAAGRTTHPAYVLQGLTAEQLLLLTIEDNRRHGLPLTEKERLRILVRLVRESGRTQNDAAAICGVSPAKASRALAVDAADQRARRHDVEGWDHVNATVRWRLGAITHDEAFIAASEFAAVARLSQPDVVDLVRAVEAAASVDQALAVIGTEADHHHSGARGAARRTAGRPSSRVQLAGALGTIANLQPHSVLGQLDTPGERAELARQITNAAKVLQAVMVGIEKAGR